MYADVDFSGTFSQQKFYEKYQYFTFKMTGPFTKLFSAQGYGTQKSIIQKTRINVRKKVVLGG